jgi:hypothetical protein
MRSLPIAAILALLTACAANPANPSFPVTSDQAHSAIEHMQKYPEQLQRPLVIVGGFMDPGVAPPIFAHYFAGISSDATIIPVSIGLCGSFDECRDTVISAVDKACPSSDPQWTSEVDVVGISLGGLVARYAAAPPRPDSTSTSTRRLKIARLFTISSPHSGATLAQAIGFTDFQKDMQPGSDFLTYLANTDPLATYDLFPYVHLDDEIVGDRFAAPPGENPYWLPNIAPLPPHMGAVLDERILADISRRLRSERPFTIPPAGPLPFSQRSDASGRSPAARLLEKSAISAATCA